MGRISQLLFTANLVVDRDAISSHSEVSRRIHSLFNSSKDLARNRLQSAMSKIHIGHTDREKALNKKEFGDWIHDEGFLYETTAPSFSASNRKVSLRWTLTSLTSTPLITCG